MAPRRAPNAMDARYPHARSEFLRRQACRLSIVTEQIANGETLDAANWHVTIPPSGPGRLHLSDNIGGPYTLIKRLMPWNTRRLERMAYIAATTTTYPQP